VPPEQFWDGSRPCVRIGDEWIPRALVELLLATVGSDDDTSGVITSNRDWEGPLHVLERSGFVRTPSRRHAWSPRWFGTDRLAEYVSAAGGLPPKLRARHQRET